MKVSKRKWIWTQSIIGVVVILLVTTFIPFIFKDRTEKIFFGSSLSEIDYNEIFFDNGDLRLSGMIVLPEGEGPFPVSVIIHGSGTSKRDNRWYLSLAEHLTKNGIAVLLPDKRGSEKSEGDWRTSNFTDLAEDTIRAIEFVREQTQFNYSYIGVIGISQGGWIAPIVATKNEDVSFVVSIVGAATTTDEQLLHEEIYNIADYTYLFIAKMIAPIIVYSVSRDGYWSKYIKGFDPVPYWEDVDVPIFAAFGENDRNVPVEESVRIFKEIKKSHDIDISIKVYPEGHGIIDPNTHKINEDYLSDLTEFIKVQVK